MADNLEAMVARIDERTEHMEGDIKEVKDTCKCLTQAVGEHSKDLATIKEKIANSDCTPTLTRKQKVSATTAIVAFVAALIAAIAEYFKHH